MKTQKDKLPEKVSSKIYSLKNTAVMLMQDLSYSSDLTTPCTSVTTTTHFRNDR